jgi:hypothetical protein
VQHEGGNREVECDEARGASLEGWVVEDGFVDINLRPAGISRCPDGESRQKDLRLLLWPPR